MKFKLYMLLVAGLCITMPATAATLTYTSDLLMYSGNVRLCAEGLNDLDQPAAGEPVLFRALDLWNITRTAPGSIAETDSAGHTCLSANLSPGVYEAQAFGTDGAMSQPVAITVVGRYAAWQANSGTLQLREPGQSQSRLATFGMYYAWPSMFFTSAMSYGYKYYTEGSTEQFLLLDPDHPGGAVRVRMRQFREAYDRYREIKPDSYVYLDTWFIGYCDFTIGDSEPATRWGEIVFSSLGTRMDVDVYDYARRSIYHAGGLPLWAWD